MRKTSFTSVPTKIEDVCDPTRLALVIYDMQCGIVSQVRDGDEITANVRSLIVAARERGYRVFYTRHQWLPNCVAGIGALRRALIWQKVDDVERLTLPFAPGSDLWQIVPELAPRPDEVVIDKITMSCFEATFLDLALRDAQIQAFAIAGVALEVGIEPSVRQAMDLNYIPIIVTDACGFGSRVERDRALNGLASTGELLTIETSALTALLGGEAA
jgi:nicotinamidase-related amidase